MLENKDLLIYESGNGGELAVDGDILLTNSLFSQIYLSLFGGNVDAVTRGDELSTELRHDWWGNSFFDENISKQMNSVTEKALNNSTGTSAGRIVIQRAVETDLKYFREYSDLSVTVSVVSPTEVVIYVMVSEPKNTPGFTLQFAWDNAKKEIIYNTSI